MENRARRLVNTTVPRAPPELDKSNRNISFISIATLTGSDAQLKSEAAHSDPGAHMEACELPSQYHMPVFDGTSDYIDWKYQTMDTTP